MISQYLKNLLLDRLYIRATNKLRRSLKPRELTHFFTKYNRKVSDIVLKAEKEMDILINKFLEELQEKEGK